MRMALEKVGDKEYQTRNDCCVYLVTRELNDKTQYVCEATSGDAAKRIVRALNEAEGF